MACRQFLGLTETNLEIATYFCRYSLIISVVIMIHSIYNTISRFKVTHVYLVNTKCHRVTITNICGIYRISSNMNFIIRLRLKKLYSVPGNLYNCQGTTYRSASCVLCYVYTG